MLEKNYFKIVLINDTSLNRHFGCHFLMKEMNKLLKDNKFIVKKRIFNDENNIYNEVTKINSEQIDFAIINGEGTLHGQENPKVNEILKCAEFLSLKLKKKVFLFNSTVADLNEDQLKYFQYFTKIYVREISSYNFLNKNNINSDIVPDFLIGYNFNYKFIQKNKNINYTDSSFKKLDIDFGFKNKINEIQIKYYNRLEYYISRLYIKFKFLSFFYYFLQYLKNYRANNFIKNIINSKLLVTGRFHAMIMCFALQIPFFAYKSQSSKIEGVLNDAGLFHRFINLSGFQLSSEDNFKLTNEELEKINFYRKKGTSKINSMFEEIKKIIYEKN